jgi:apurinic endonuclease APN1
MEVHLSSSGLVIGTHVSFNKTLSKTLSYAISTGMYAFQFFLGSPQSFTRTKLSDDDIQKSKNLMDKYPMNIFTHAPYVYNIAKDNKDCVSSIGSAISSLEKELNQVSIFGGKGVVLHPGSNPNKKKGIEEIARNISKINFGGDSNNLGVPKLILENMSGQGNMIGSYLEELRDIRKQVDEDKRKFIGFCIDTAHIWGMGLYDLSEEKEIDKMFDDITNILGIENISLFHVNDSKAKFGSKLDRHHLLCEGEIWGNKKGDSLRYLLKKINSYGIPIILETDPSDITKFLY